MPGVTPADPAIFHITHVDNLPGILAQGGLWSDSERAQQGLITTNIGYHHIKARRMRRTVTVAAGGFLGDYVPFYFCSRSIMLYVIAQGHVDYQGGQEQVVHLVSSVSAAASLGTPYAFSDRHAELGHAIFYTDLGQLGAVNWDVMPLRFWADTDETKERRQAEFLVHRFFPWHAVARIGVRDRVVAARVRALLGQHPVRVDVQPDWYY